MPARGENAAQKRLSEAEAEMEIRNWEKRNSDIAPNETHQELESVRGLLSAQVPNSSFAEAHSELLPEPTHMEDEDEDQENEKEDERDRE